MKFSLRRGGADRLPADWLVVGLGNPGERYAGTRHNMGFRVINELARRARVQPRASGRAMAIAVGEIAGTRVALVKPRTYMNESGVAVRAALTATGCPLERTIVVYDEIDLPAGSLRIRRGGGHGGNNGLKSIGAHVGLDFIRIRIGIGRPTVAGEPSWDPDVVAAWVLASPDGDDRAKLEAAARDAADAVACVITDGVDVAGSRFNRR